MNAAYSPNLTPKPTTQSSPYPYAGNDPINNTDVDGRDLDSAEDAAGDAAKICATGAAVGLSIGAAGPDETGIGALGAAGGGCFEGLLAEATDKVTHSLIGTGGSFIKDTGDLIDLF